MLNLVEPINIVENHFKTLLTLKIMAEITPYTCGAEPGTYSVISDCASEESKIVAVALIKAGFDVSALNATDDELRLAAWDAAITAGNVKLITEVSGNWPEASENTIKGMGFIENRTSSYSYDIPFEHYGVDANLPFWNAMIGSSKWSAGFIFEDFKMYIALNKAGKLIPMSFNPRPTSEETKGNLRTMKINARWKSRDLPYSVVVPADLLLPEEE
jgi:hypothetical protein